MTNYLKIFFCVHIILDRNLELLCLLKKIYWKLLIYHVMLVSGVQQSESVTDVYRQIFIAKKFKAWKKLKMHLVRAGLA